MPLYNIKTKTMKTKLLIILTVLCGMSNAQTPTWNWAKSAGGNGNDYGNDIVVDAAGNSYVIGTFNDTAIFNTDTLIDKSLNGGNMFLAKYDMNGNLLWVQQAGNPMGFYQTVWCEGTAISIDTSGNIYTAGSYTAKVVFGTDTLPFGNSGVFIAKYNSNGNVLWATSLSPAISVSFGNPLRDITVDINGNCYLTGFHNPWGASNPDTLTNKGISDIFLCKINNSGILQWIKSNGGTATDQGFFIHLDTASNIYIGGYFNSDTAYFGGITIIKNITPITAAQVPFIAKYNSSGNPQWVKQGDEYNAWYIDAASDYIGNIYSQIPFITDTIIVNSTTYISKGIGDILLTKINSSGNVVWIKQFGGTGDDGVEAINMDTSGNIIAYGYFQDTIILGIDTLIASSTYDYFLVKYNSSGNIISASALHSGSDIIEMALDINGNAYFTSYYSGTANFGSTNLTSVNSNWDIFVAKLSQGTLTNISDNYILKDKLLIFPNPFSSQAVLQADNLLKGATLTVYNCFGQTVKQIKNISGQAVTLLRDNLPSGLYFIRLTEENKIIAVDKLVISDK